MTAFASAPPDVAVRSLASVLRDVHDGHLLSPRLVRGFVWSPSHVVELWTALTAGHPIGSVLVRSEPSGTRLAPISTLSACSVDASVVLPGCSATGVYDGFNRLAGLSMTAYARWVRVGHTNRSISWRIAYDPFAETFHHSTALLLDKNSALFPDISALFRVSGKTEVQEVVTRYGTAIRSTKSSALRKRTASEICRAEANLLELSAVLDTANLFVVSMHAGASDAHALEAMLLANGVVNGTQLPR